MANLGSYDIEQNETRTFPLADFSNLSVTAADIDVGDITPSVGVPHFTWEYDYADRAIRVFGQTGRHPDDAVEETLTISDGTNSDTLSLKVVLPLTTLDPDQIRIVDMHLWGQGDRIELPTGEPYFTSTPPQPVSDNTSVIAVGGNATTGYFLEARGSSETDPPTTRTANITYGPYDFKVSVLLDYFPLVYRISPQIRVRLFAAHLNTIAGNVATDPFIYLHQLPGTPTHPVPITYRAGVITISARSGALGVRFPVQIHTAAIVLRNRGSQVNLAAQYMTLFVCTYGGANPTIGPNTVVRPARVGAFPVPTFNQEIIHGGKQTQEYEDEIPPPVRTARPLPADFDYPDPPRTQYKELVLGVSGKAPNQTSVSLEDLEKVNRAPFVTKRGKQYDNYKDLPKNFAVFWPHRRDGDGKFVDPEDQQ